MSIKITRFIKPPFESWAPDCGWRTSSEPILSIARLKRTRDGAETGHVGTAMKRKAWCVRDNGFHTNATRLVRGGIKELHEVLALDLGCHVVGLLV
jgi:hypothetical protein